MTQPIAPRRGSAPRIRSLEEATTLLGRIGSAQSQLDRLKLALDVKIAQARLDHDEAAAPLVAAIEADTERLRGYCEANRPALLKGKSKTALFATGTAGWRKRAGKVVVAEGTDLLAVLKADRKLRRFVRIKEEADLQLLLKEPAVACAIPGVSIDGGDDVFFVKPHLLAAV